MSLINLTTDFKPYIKDNATLNILGDAVYQSAIDTAEVRLNAGCGRQFVVASVTPETRTFKVSGDAVRIDDAATVTHINGVAFDANEYLCEPIEHRHPDSGTWRPYDRITKWSCFPYSRWGTCTVTGTWGWTAIPVEVKEACKILAKDILSNRDVAFGIAAFTEYAAIKARSNPQVWDLVLSLRGSKTICIA